MLEKIKDLNDNDAWIDLECVTSIRRSYITEQQNWVIALVGDRVLVTESTARHVAALCSK